MAMAKTGRGVEDMRLKHFYFAEFLQIAIQSQ